MSDVVATDQLLPTTCQTIVDEVERAVQAEIAQNVQSVLLPGGVAVGKQIVIDATEKTGRVNRCRFSLLNPDRAPAGEVVRIEFEHDKEGKFGVHRVYSVQSVRRVNGVLVLLENFLADDATLVREEDFRPILSESYAQRTVLKSVQDWAKYRAWQRQEAAKH